MIGKKYDDVYNETLKFYNGDSLATSVFLKKYAVQNDNLYYETTLDDLRDRLANTIVDVEDDKSYKDKFRDLLDRFLPAGRVCYGLGNPYDDNATFSNCYVIDSPDDNLESIFKTASEQARIFSRGGGVGLDVSKLRPKDSKVNNVAKTSTGSVSFMDLYSMVTGLISQNSRRGALMLTMECSHPDLIEFIKVKGGNDKTKVQFANISIKITNDFMLAVENNSDWNMEFKFENGEKFTKTEKAKDIWELIVASNWQGAEPGILLWDNVLTSPSSVFEYSKPISTNPCFSGDTIVAVADGRNGVTIKELSEKSEEFLVYSARPKKSKGKWKTEIKKAIAFKTGTKKIVKVLLSDGSIIKCTEDHLLAMSNKNDYVKAIQSKGCELAKFYTFSNITTNKSYRHINSMTNGYAKQYRMMWNHLHGNYDGTKFNLNHIDSDSTNDFVDNLELVSLEDHKKKTERSQEKNPIHKLTGSLYLSLYSTRNAIYGNCVRYGWSDERLKTELKSFDDQYGDLLKELKRKDINHYSLSEKIFVADVIITDLEEDVYDLTVEDNHNFYIITKTNDDKYMNCSGVLVHNCGEQPLPAYGSCNLGSMNLTKYVRNPFTENAFFDFDLFKKDVKLATRFMSNMNLINKDRQPLPQNKEVIDKTNAIGLGFTALADMLVKLNLKYDSDEAIEFTEYVIRTLKEYTVKASIDLAKERGCFSLLKEASEEERKNFLTNKYFDFLKEEHNKDYLKDFLTFGTHNLQFNTVAPNGSISIILQTSSGIEPIFCTEYERTVMTGDENNSKKFIVYHPLVKEYETITGKSYKDNPNFVTAEQIDWKQRIKMQSAIQKNTSESISSTINLSEDVSKQTISDIYFTAWKSGLKGVTVYRDKCREGVFNKIKEKQSEIYLELPFCSDVKFPNSTDAKMRVIKSESRKWYITYTIDNETKLPNSLFVNTNSTETNIATVGVLDELKKLATQYIRQTLIVDLESKISHQSNVVKMTRFLSMLLRHRVPIIEIIKSIEKSNIAAMSFAYRIKGLLAEFIEGKIDGDCPECNSKMTYQNGCKMCQNCGYSKCG